MSEADTERYGYSESTGNWYRVTDWEDLGDGKMVAKSKERVDESEVPDEWKGALEWSLTGTDGNGGDA